MTFPFPYFAFDSAKPLDVQWLGGFAADGVNRTTYSFASQSFGAPGDERYLLVGVLADSTTSTTLSSVTVGGQPAQIIAAPVASIYPTCGFAIVRLDAGVSGTVTVAWSGSQSRCAITLWRIQNLKSTVPFDSPHMISSASTGNLTGNQNYARGGCVFGLHTQRSNTVNTWTGLTRRFDANIETGTADPNRRGSAADSGAMLESGTLSCTVASSTAEKGMALLSLR